MAHWNPRYVAYARQHGRTPEAQMEFDREEYPGGCMVGFMLWVQGLLREHHVEARWLAALGASSYRTHESLADEALGVIEGDGGIERIEEVSEGIYLAKHGGV